MRKRTNEIENLFDIRRVGIPRAPLQDLYHFFMERSWAFLLFGVAAVYLTLNLIFALLFMIDPSSIDHAQHGSLRDAFFFSVQTMSTIGYGGMGPANLYGDILVTVEAVVGLLTTALTTGLAFAKFSRPTSRVVFSNNAVLCTRDGVFSLLFRVANERGNRINQAELNLTLLLDDTTPEGENVRRIIDLPLVRNTTPSFMLSWTAVHQIDENSPIYGMDANALRAQDAIFLVMLTGTDESYAANIHCRTLYRYDDLMWNASFVDIFSKGPDGSRTLNYNNFHKLKYNQP